MVAVFDLPVTSDCGMSAVSKSDSVNNSVVSGQSSSHPVEGEDYDIPLAADNIAVAELPPSTSMPDLPPAAVSPLVVPISTHEVSVPEITASGRRNQLDGPRFNYTEDQVSTHDGIYGREQDTAIDRAQVRYAAYRASLTSVEQDTGVSLDNFPVCEHVEVKVDGSNASRLALPFKRYLSAVKKYLMQWKCVFGSPGFLRLLSIGHNAAEQAIYGIGRAAQTGEMQKRNPSEWAKLNEAVASLINFAESQRFELMARHDTMFPRYAAADVHDSVLPDDSVSPIGSSA